MFTWLFWKQALERAIKTAAQGVISAGIIGPTTDMFTLDWMVAASFAISGFVLSVLTSIVSVNIGPTDNSPSAV